MLTNVNHKSFANGTVYALKTEDGYLIETTDTFLPECTKYCKYDVDGYGSRAERWMIGVSVMSGCPVGCKFCATGNMKKWRNLSTSEILKQVGFVLGNNSKDFHFRDAKEHKINYTRMGEPFLNINSLRNAIDIINRYLPGTHHYVSTIGIKGSDFSWIKDNITLQISLHSLDEDRRNELIPYKNKMSIKELGQIRTKSNLKTTLNLTLVDTLDFDIEKLKEYFDPEYFFIKLSPINPNAVSNKNNFKEGIINGNNY
jgi:adenine C2-methylase RlmN of 23S rRNA A2503 and tRNA A37